MRRLITAILLFVALAGVGASQSSPPSRTPGKAGNKKEEASSGKTQETDHEQDERHLATDNPTSLPPTGADSTKSRDQVGNKMANDSWLVVFTAALVGATFLQVGVAIFQFCAMRKQAAYMKQQAHVMRHGLRISRKSADAAKQAADAARLNAKAMIQTERPWIVVSVRKDRTDLFDSFDLKNRPERFSFHVKNVGRTPAEILHITVFEDLIPMKERTPEVPRCKTLRTYIEHAPLLAPEEPWEFDHLIMSRLFYEGDEVKDIQRGILRLLRYGIITYRNTSDPDNSNLLETKFCCTYDFLLKRLERLFIPNYSGYK